MNACVWPCGRNRKLTAINRGTKISTSHIFQGVPRLLLENLVLSLNGSPAKGKLIPNDSWLISRCRKDYNFIKTTYDISLNSQISLLPSGFSPQQALALSFDSLRLPLHSCEFESLVESCSFLSLDISWLTVNSQEESADEGKVKRLLIRPAVDIILLVDAFILSHLWTHRSFNVCWFVQLLTSFCLWTHSFCHSISLSPGSCNVWTYSRNSCPNVWTQQVNACR